MTIRIPLWIFEAFFNFYPAFFCCIWLTGLAPRVPGKPLWGSAQAQQLLEGSLKRSNCGTKQFSFWAVFIYLSISSWVLHGRLNLDTVDPFLTQSPRQLQTDDLLRCPSQSHFAPRRSGGKCCSWFRYRSSFWMSKAPKASKANRHFSARENRRC